MTAPEQSTLPADFAERMRDLLSRVDPDIYARLVGSLSLIYAPGCSDSCWDWVHKNIWLSPEESREHHGQYDGLLTIYVKRVMDFINAPVEQEKELIIRKSAQLGFTLAYLLIICYVAATRPTHVLFGMDSAKEAKNISERLQRLLTTNTALAGTFTDAGEEDLQNLLIRLRGMLVHLNGSGSPGAYANKSIGLAILDELDKHVPMPGKHANTIDLARDRLKKVQQGKLIAGGTPAAYEGETNENFMTGTREELHAPCPHCQHMQPFHWERMRFDHCKDLNGQWDFDRVLHETYLECENELCPDRRIRNADKARMLRPECIKWVVGNRGQDDWKPVPARSSIWISDLYSQDPQTTWGHLAIKWIDAQKSPSKLISFFNETLGRPRKEEKLELSKSDLRRLTGGYEHGCMPKRPAINPATGAAAIFIGSDVQGSGEKKWVKIGICPGGEAYVIDYGRAFHLDELRAEAAEPVWIGFEAPSAKELEDMKGRCLSEGRDYYQALREAYPDREFFTMSVGGVDEGHDTFVVRDFCHSTGDYSVDPAIPPLFFPFKGISKVNAIEMVHEIRDKFRTAKDDENAPFITVYHFSDDDLKRELYVGRIGGFDAIKSGKSTIPRLWFPAYAEDEFLSELTQEKRGQIKWKGRLVWRWLDPKGANDWGDAVKIVLALWHVVRGQFPAPPEQQAAA